MTVVAQSAQCELCKLLAVFDEGRDTAAALIWRDAQLAVVLVDDAASPGFCRVIWHDHVKEMTDLPLPQRSHIMQVVWQVEQAQREVMRPEKINLASFGNMTPHVHWHVIPRYTDDAYFPDPNWAPARRTTPLETLAQRRDLLPQLRAAIVERLSGLGDT